MSIEENKEDSLDDQVCDLYNQALTMREIADRLGISVGSVSHRVRKLSSQGLIELRGRQRPASHGSARPVNTHLADAVQKLTWSQCRWPIGDPQSDDFRFCCEPIPKGSKKRYCEQHAKDSVDRVRTRRRK